MQFFWNVWNFGKNQSAAKSLIVHLSQRAAAEKMVEASAGYDLPPFNSFTNFKTWAEEGPPKGTLYHYPNPHEHQTLSDPGLRRRRTRSASRSRCRPCRPRWWCAT